MNTSGQCVECPHFARLCDLEQRERGMKHRDLVSISRQLHDGVRSECWSQFENPLAARCGISTVSTLGIPSRAPTPRVSEWLQKLSQEIIEDCGIVRTVRSAVRSGKSQQTCGALQGCTAQLPHTERTGRACCWYSTGCLSE